MKKRLRSRKSSNAIFRFDDVWSLLDWGQPASWPLSFSAWSCFGGGPINARPSCSGATPRRSKRPSPVRWCAAPRCRDPYGHLPCSAQSRRRPTIAEWTLLVCGDATCMSSPQSQAPSGSRGNLAPPSSAAETQQRPEPRKLSGPLVSELTATSSRKRIGCLTGR